MTHDSLMTVWPCLVLRSGQLVVWNHYWIASEQQKADRGLPATPPGGRWFACFQQRCGGDTGSLGGSRNVVHSRIWMTNCNPKKQKGWVLGVEGCFPRIFERCLERCIEMGGRVAHETSGWWRGWRSACLSRLSVCRWGSLPWKSDVLFSFWRILHSWFPWTSGPAFVFVGHQPRHLLHHGYGQDKNDRYSEPFQFQCWTSLQQNGSSRHALIRQGNPLRMCLPQRHSRAEWWWTLRPQRAICKRCEPPHCNLLCAAMALESGIIDLKKNLS